MKFVLRVSLWSTLAFAGCWLAHPAWQRMIGAIGAYVAAPPHSTIQIDDLEYFFPFDIGVFAALCMASSWASTRRRLRALVLGAPALVLIEVFAVAASIRIMMGAEDPAAAWRSVDAVVRVLGLVASAAVWLLTLGGERLSLTSRRWIAD